MPNHDRYDNDILKQLTRIANSLEKIETMLETKYAPSFLIKSNDDQGRGTGLCQPEDEF